MKINITKDKAQFIVNEDARKVVCIIDHTSYLFLHYAEKNLKIQPDCDNLWGGNGSRLYPRLKMPNKFVGIASCNPEDEFSVETGKLIAFSRAKDKIQTSFFKRANLYVNTLDTWLNQAMDSINSYGAKIEINTARRHNKITSLIGEPEEK
jgi:hypothetical protein